MDAREAPADTSQLSTLNSQLIQQPSGIGHLSSSGFSAPAAPGLTAFEAEVVEVFVGVSKVFGLPKSYGEIYGLLFASAQPLGFSEIQAKLGISKGSVSQGLRALRELGAVTLAGQQQLTADGQQMTADDRRQTADEQLTADGRRQMADGQQVTADGRQQTAEPRASGVNHRPPGVGVQPSAIRPQPSDPVMAAKPHAAYLPVLELRRVVSAFLQASIEPQLTQSRANLTRAGELLQPAATALSRDERDLLLQRLGKLQTWHHRAKSLLPWAVRFLG